MIDDTIRLSRLNNTETEVATIITLNIIGNIRALAISPVSRMGWRNFFFFLRAISEESKNAEIVKWV